MTAKDTIRMTLGASDHIITIYLDGLGDADLRLQPVKGMNPIAWQIAHLIQVERMMVEAARPGLSPSLPEGFEADHPRKVEDHSKMNYRPIEQYLEAWKAQRAATLQALDSLSDEELDAPTPERFQRMAKTQGQMFNLAGLHALGHAGQFVATRRKLEKPIAF